MATNVPTQRCRRLLSAGSRRANFYQLDSDSQEELDEATVWGLPLSRCGCFRESGRKGEQVDYEVSDITGPSRHLRERPGLNASWLAVTTAQARDPPFGNPAHRIETESE